MNSGSSTITNGRWRRAIQRSSVSRNLPALYVDPWANVEIARLAVSGSQLSACQTRLLVLSSCQALVTLIEGDL
jgi:hypothetical protein